LEKAMFAVVRTGGKQYRVAAGDKIVVEKLAGEAGDTISLGDVLLAGEGSELRSTDGLTVSAEIIAQAKGDKVIVFKKKRRHNYRRKAGHRQQHTILRITAIGDQKAEKPKKPVPSKVDGAARPAAEQPAAEAATPAAAPAEKPAKAAKAEAPKAEAAEKTAKPKAAKPAKPVPSKVEGAEAAPKPEAPLKAGPTKKASTKQPTAGKKA
jgi:large subunit ribosomal protein L21